MATSYSHQIRQVRKRDGNQSRPLCHYRYNHRKQLLRIISIMAKGPGLVSITLPYLANLMAIRCGHGSLIFLAASVLKIISQRAQMEKFTLKRKIILSSQDFPPTSICRAMNGIRSIKTQEKMLRYWQPLTKTVTSGQPISRWAI